MYYYTSSMLQAKNRFKKSSAQRKEVTQKKHTAVSSHAEEILGFQRIVHSVSISIYLLC